MNIRPRGSFAGVRGVCLGTGQKGHRSELCGAQSVDSAVFHFFWGEGFPFKLNPHAPA